MSCSVDGKGTIDWILVKIADIISSKMRERR